MAYVLMVFFRIDSGPDTQETILDESKNQKELSNSETDENTDLESDDEMCAYEKLRMRNIAEREKLFHDLKISQMK